MENLNPQPLLQHTSLLGEGPVWDSAKHRLLWVDILRGHIHEYYPKYGEHKTIDVGEKIGAVALRRGGGLVAALQSGFYFVDEESGARTPIANPEAHISGNRFNDGKCDPAGRFWAGTMSLHDEPKKGSLYTLETGGTVRRKVEGVSISNGLAWSGDGSLMYYIDTPTKEVAVFDFDVSSGNISNRRVAIRIPYDFGDPDGMTIDTKGALWIAHWDGWQVTRWNPESGELLARIKLPAARITSCTFGGDGLKDLYITSAREGLSEEALEAQPLAGSVFVIKACGSQGLPPHQYAGSLEK